MVDDYFYNKNDERWLLLFVPVTRPLLFFGGGISVGVRAVFQTVVVGQHSPKFKILTVQDLVQVHT